MTPWREGYLREVLVAAIVFGTLWLYFGWLAALGCLGTGIAIGLLLRG